VCALPHRTTDLRVCGALQTPETMLHHFTLTHSEQGAASAMRMQGEFDVATAPRFRRVVGELMAGGVRDVTVDLTDTVFVDSTGLGAVLWAERRLRAVGGSVTVVNPQENVARTFEMAGLDRLLA
jgi:anti-sigma B factor antagonist